MANAGTQAGRKRLVHQLDTPFSAPQWPVISSEDQETILELLCELLSPIGKHRKGIKRSKGKRAAASEKLAATVGSEPANEPPKPPMPEIEAYVDVGLNSITRTMQSVSQETREGGPAASCREYAMVFVARGNQTSVFNCHFPQMVGAASKQLPVERRARLVGFSKPCSDKLSACLELPRVSSLAIVVDAPGAGALQDLVRKIVTPVEMEWLEGPKERQYLETKINTIETTTGPKRSRND